MDVVAAVSGYITKMVSSGESSASGKMKILLLDNETVSIVSTATTQSALLNHEVFLIDRLDNPTRERMRHLRCLCFVRPSPESIQYLIEELREPKYGEYNLYFSNIIRKSSLERLAEADDHEVVRTVQEFFADYIVINPDLFTFNMSYPMTKIYGASPELWDMNSLQRTTEGLLAVLLSLKKKPMIRYEKNSLMAKKLAGELSYQIMTHNEEHQQLFDFRRTAADTPPVLLILDRRDDPITPLLTQWTYQAMVHELLGIRNGRVDLKDVPDIRPELKEIVLTQDQDPFFKKNMYLNFGDLGSTIKEYVGQYQLKTQNQTSNIESISDMKRFIEEYPEFRKLSGNVSKHVTLVGELSRRVTEDGLLESSELEQSLACGNENHNGDLKNIQKMIQSPLIPPSNKLRIVCLYAIRYEKHPSNALPILLDLLSTVGEIPSTQISIIPKILAYHHSLQPSTSSLSTTSGGPSNTNTKESEMKGFTDLFESTSLGVLTDRIRSLNLKKLKGVENVYTQHSPRLGVTLQNLMRGRLKDGEYPYLENTVTNGSGNGKGSDNVSGQAQGQVNVMGKGEKPQDIIIFIIGGVTYEEAKMVASINNPSSSGSGGGGGTAGGIGGGNNGVRVVLGGTSILNCESFWEEVSGAIEAWPKEVLGRFLDAGGRLRGSVGGSR